MSLTVNVGFESYKPWSGAVDTYKELEDLDLLQAFENMLEELYPDGMSNEEINDILWFENEWIYESLGIVDMDEIDEDEFCFSAAEAVDLDGIETIEDLMKEVKDEIEVAISELGNYIVNEYLADKYFLQVLKELMEIHDDEDDEDFPKELVMKAIQAIEI